MRSSIRGILKSLFIISVALLRFIETDHPLLAAEQRFRPQPPVAGAASLRVGSCALSPNPLMDRKFWNTVRMINSGQAYASSSLADPEGSRACSAYEIDLDKTVSEFELRLKFSSLPSDQKAEENKETSEKTKQVRDANFLRRVTLELEVAQFLSKKVGSRKCVDRYFYDSLVKSVRAVKFHSNLDYTVEEVSTLLYLALKNQNQWQKTAQGMNQNRGRRIEVPIEFSYWGWGPQSWRNGLRSEPVFSVDPNGHLSVEYRSDEGMGAYKIVTRRLVLTDNGTGLLYLNPRAIAKTNNQVKAKYPNRPDPIEDDIRAGIILRRTVPTLSHTHPRKQNPPCLAVVEFRDASGNIQKEIEIPLRTRDLDFAQSVYDDKEAPDGLENFRIPQLLESAYFLSRDLEEIHAKHVVLNDIKPPNMMVRGYGSRDQLSKKTAESIDLASAQSYLQWVRFRPDDLLPLLDYGTARYISPERANHGRSLNPEDFRSTLQNPIQYIELVQKSDIYSFGLSLAEILATTVRAEILSQRANNSTSTLLNRFKKLERDLNLIRFTQFGTGGAVAHLAGSGLDDDGMVNQFQREQQQFFAERMKVLETNQNEYGKTPEYILMKIATASIHPNPKYRPNIMILTSWLHRLNSDQNNPFQLAKLEKEIVIDGTR